MIIYKTTNLINNKIYIGRDAHNNPNYIGSGKYLLLSIAKHGRENFKKEILEHCTSNEHLNEREIYWIAKLNSRDPKIGYNVAIGGEHFMLGVKPSAKTIQKISDAGKGKIPWNKGKTKESDPRVMQISKTMTGVSHTEERTKKNSDSNKGRVPWNKGLNRSTDERVNNYVMTASKTLTGKTPWNKGLTKETDDRVKRAAEKLTKELQI